MNELDLLRSSDEFGERCQKEWYDQRGHALLTRIVGSDVQSGYEQRPAAPRRNRLLIAACLLPIIALAAVAIVGRAAEPRVSTGPSAAAGPLILGDGYVWRSEPGATLLNAALGFGEAACQRGATVDEVPPDSASPAIIHITCDSAVVPLLFVAEGGSLPAWRLLQAGGNGLTVRRVEGRVLLTFVPPASAATGRVLVRVGTATTALDLNAPALAAGNAVLSGEPTAAVVVFVDAGGAVVGLIGGRF
jgi:hypothetical protein